MRTRLLIIAGMIVFAHTAGLAFTGVSAPSLSMGERHTGVSLLDLSRVSIKNSLMFGYSSGVGRKESAGALFTTLGYRFSPRLMVRATLSKEFSIYGRDSSDQNISLSGLKVDWKPIDSMHFHLEFARVPSLWQERTLFPRNW